MRELYARRHIISTHAPAGGATSFARFACFVRPISTHAPAGGATKLRRETRVGVSEFLLTPLREGRQIQPGADPSGDEFLLTPLREGRPEPGHGVGDILALFLLTPLREGRRRSPIFLRLNWKFLLTPLREGRRGVAVVRRHDLRISTHAPAGGATNISAVHRLLLLYFYSRPCGRGDLAERLGYEPEETFLLTPLREGRRGR